MLATSAMPGKLFQATLRPDFQQTLMPHWSQVRSGVDPFCGFKANCFFRLTKKGNSCTLQEHLEHAATSCASARVHLLCSLSARLSLFLTHIEILLRCPVLLDIFAFPHLYSTIAPATCPLPALTSIYLNCLPSPL
jgi:hypothetical protein